MTDKSISKKIKALVMLSGGLDSILAVRILQEEGIEVEAAHYRGVFHPGKFDEYDSSAERFADKFAFKLTIFPIEEDFLEVLKNPRYGYGSNINPCVDCRIYLLKKARAYMEEEGFSFIATGEVLGQRPMSQRKDMLGVVEKRSGLEGLLLRPLSAKLLEPTAPEKNGWVDRERLYDINGRSRRPQMALAEKYGVRNYPAPAGGCLLTDAEFSAKVRDLIRHNNLSTKEMEFLKTGRHFRLSGATKAIVGRNKGDNARIAELLERDDILLKLKEIPGPMTILRGRPTEEDVKTAGAITARYSKAKNDSSVKISKYVIDTDSPEGTPSKKKKLGSSFSTRAADDGVIKKYLVGLATPR